jgi:arsenite methyltransferase
VIAAGSAGCVFGAIQKESYLELINTNGFKNVIMLLKNLIRIYDDRLAQYLQCGFLGTIRKK